MTLGRLSRHPPSRNQGRGTSRDCPPLFKGNDTGYAHGFTHSIWLSVYSTTPATIFRRDARDSPFLISSGSTDVYVDGVDGPAPLGYAFIDGATDGPASAEVSSWLSFRFFLACPSFFGPDLSFYCHEPVSRAFYMVQQAKENAGAYLLQR